jgi:ubiquinone/menaquinone biosynthesis C-methylase UbiE
VGVDNSESMLAVARHRFGSADNVEFEAAEATALPFPDRTFDAAISVQVFEYLRDVPFALAELHRAIRTGGRLVIWDTDWATVSWHSSDDDRMRRVLKEWDAHLRHPSLPPTLGAHLRAAGWCDVDVAGYTFTNTELTQDSVSASLIGLVTNFVAPRLGTELTEAWASDLQELGEAGRYFFTCAQFCFAANKRG